MYSQQQYHQGVALQILVLSTISAAALIFIMVVYITGWKQISSFPMRLVFYLCVACLIQDLYIFIMTPFKVHRESSADQINTDAWCTTMAVFKTGADLSSVMWTFLVTYSAYASVVKNSDLSNTQWKLLLIGFVAPFIIAIIPAPIPGVYGYTDYYCWFSETGVLAITLQVTLYYLPLWAFFIANTVLFALTYRKLKDLQLDPSQLRVFKRMLLFPLILFLVAFFATIHRIVLFSGVDSVVLAYMDYFFDSLYGFMNALAYGLNPNIRDYIQKLMCQRCKDQLPDRTSSMTDKHVDREIFLAEITG